MKENILKVKSFEFGLKIISLYKYLKDTHNEYILSKQVLRSGTAIGALIREAEHAESTRDFLHKLNIALKETNETKYWLDLLLAARFINDSMFNAINEGCEELLKLLVASVKTTKLKLQ